MDLGTGDRRGFLRAGVGRWFDWIVERTEERIVQERRVRPPGAQPELAFVTSCTRCGECVSACPVGAVLVVGTDGGLAAGTPYLDLRRQPCIGCATMPCARACPTDALAVPPDGWAGVRLSTIELVPERCVTFAGTPCGVCAEACPVGDTALAIDENGHPVLKAEGCIGCGVCVRACIASPSAFLLRTAKTAKTGTAGTA